MALFIFGRFRPLLATFGHFRPLLAGRPAKTPFGRLFSNPAMIGQGGKDQANEKQYDYMKIKVYICKFVDVQLSIQTMQ